MTGASYTHVTLVVDPDFGGRAKHHAELGPLWVIDTLANTRAIKEIWATGKLPFENAPTVFDPVAGRSAEDSAANFIGTVDLHHPDWRSFEIIGAKPTPRLLRELGDCGAGSFEETSTGFVFTRAKD